MASSSSRGYSFNNCAVSFGPNSTNSVFAEEISSDWSSLGPEPNTYFQERPLLWEKLNKRFDFEKNCIQAITGMGGNGKSSLAAHWKME
ncbi:MAG TPA: hypothetical protein VHD33_01255, partial [Legionellaceae bacterium]|nr:hypothetical protein [Legionellaceae bacterium]